MSKHSFIRRRWKLLLNILTIIALAGLIFAIREQLFVTFKNLAKVNAWILLLMVPIQIANYHAQAKLYQSLFAIVGNKLRYNFLYKASLELNFINQIFPSGGVSGISYFGLRLRNDQITGGRATLVQIMKIAMLVLSFEVLLIAGLLFLALGDKVNNFVILTTSSITTLMVIGTIAFISVIGSERRTKSTFAFLTRLVNRIIAIFRPQSPEAISVERVSDAFAELQANYMTIKMQWRGLKQPMFWAMMANVAEVASIYVVYAAFDNWVNVGAVILAYAVANLAGFVSVMPGGIGIYEALMTGVLVASGIPAALSLPVTVMYRVINTFIQVPPGYWLYHRALHNSSAEPSEETKA